MALVYVTAATVHVLMSIAIAYKLLSRMFPTAWGGARGDACQHEHRDLAKGGKLVVVKCKRLIGALMQFGGTITPFGMG